MIEQLLAGVTLVICLALLVRLMLPSRLRYRTDAAVRRGWRKAHALVTEPYHARRLQRNAQRMADDVIRRAREGRGGEWTGNVYRPKSFKQPPKDVERPRKEH